MAARLERARGALAALEAGLELEEEEGDVPTRVLVEHQMDTRRKQKLLLSQFRVLKLLLGVIENPGQPPAPTDLREAMAQARGRWQELKAKYGEALGALEEAVPAALEQLERGQQLLQRGKAALEARLEQQEELKVKVREATERRDQLLQQVQERRLQRLRRQEEMQGLWDRVARVKASCELYQTLAGAQVLPPSPGTPKKELELGLPPGSSHSLPHLRLSLTPSGEVQLQQRCWESWSLWEEVAHLRNRFALDWQPDLGLLQVLGGPQVAQTLWTLQVEPGYPKNGGVKLLPPTKGAPPIPAPPDPPTLTRWLELLVGGGS
ncbi:ZW10 interactor-like [Melozone crissalis]|uniref:ZW10 interactor-like n=1 Tax=Melozone crissalis TaxID=40204 RepID=UPI0023DAE5B8|nr:ZW10 interactor-like [Melozone crissalis]